MRISFIVGGLVVAVIVILAISFWPEASLPPVTQEPEPVPPVPAAPAQEPSGQEEVPVIEIPQPVQIAEPEIELPALAASDQFVREHTAQWELPLSWMQRDDLIARVAVILQNAAIGAVPQRQIAFAVPPEPYPVIKLGEGFLVDPQGYRRYDGYLDMLEQIPPSQAADFLRLVEPLLVHALAQLGERESPRDFAMAAIQRIENLPPLPDQIELIRPNVVYIYADPLLENLPAFDKQVLRLGPDNISRLNSYLTEFKEYYL